MIRGAYVAVMGMRAHMARQEIVARNLANLLTVGYKQEGVATDGFSDAIGRADRLVQQASVLPAASTAPIGSLGTEVVVDRPYVDLRQGRLDETGRPLDVALQGDGFLRVRTPDGEFFSRGGPLHLDADGRLVTDEGYAVQGAGGDLVLGSGAITIQPDGAILVNGQTAGRLSVVEFAPGTWLEKVRDGLYSPVDPAVVPTEATNTTVKQGFLEASNVDEVAALSEMMWLLRAYQAGQRMFQVQDEAVGKAVNELGRV